MGTNNNGCENCWEFWDCPVELRDTCIAYTQPHRLYVNEGISQANNLQETIIFNYDSDVVSPLLYSKIEKIADILLINSESYVTIEGHTDNIGSEIYNIDLSMRRAFAVRNILIQKGIDSERINVVYMGEANPISSNSTESDRRINRRVKLRVGLSEPVYRSRLQTTLSCIG